MKPTATLLTLSMMTIVCGAAPGGALGGETEAQPDKRMIFDFSAKADLGGWLVEDDGVMGGVSQGAFALNEAGHAVFSGDVSLENNGGFSSVQNYFEPIDVSAYQATHVRLKGDGKTYRLLIEADKDARHHYVHEFPTTGEWQTVVIPFAKMVATWRGDRLELPNFPGKTLAQVRFMIANRRAESFRLVVDKIWLK